VAADARSFMHTLSSPFSSLSSPRSDDVVRGVASPLAITRCGGGLPSPRSDTVSIDDAHSCRGRLTSRAQRFNMTSVEPPMQPPTRLTRRRPVESAAAAGIVFSVTSVIALVLLRALPHQWGDKAAVWRADEANHRELAFGLGLASIAAVALLWFVAVVRRRVGELEDRFFSTVFLGSAIVYVCVWLVAAANLAAPAMARGDALSPEVIKFADAIAAGLLLSVGPRIQAVFVASASTIFLHTSVLPNWVAYLGYTVAAVLFVVPLVASPMGLAMPVFVFATSLMILVLRQFSASVDFDAES